jgi:DNA-binding transcriptional ArsR family regulator
MTDAKATSDVCEIFCFNPEKVDRLKQGLDQAKGLGNLFKGLSDETRASILFCLSQEELCVCDVASIMGMSVQAVSHHLRLLRTMNLVKYRKEGKLVYYSLEDDHIFHLIHQGLAHIQELSSGNPS